MSKKSYLSKQIRLISLTVNDFFTEEEYGLYERIVAFKNQIASMKKEQADEKKILAAQKREVQHQLDQLILSHAGTPREVLMKSVLTADAVKRGVNVIQWYDLKVTKCIAEFLSEETRSMGLDHLDVTFDKVIIKWKNIDMLKQLVMDGFYMTILDEDGLPVRKHYHVMTASAGQLRTDRVQCISDEMWERIRNKLMCGLTEEIINAKGGINVNKLMAYMALPTGATDEWHGFDIDKCIVIDDWKGDVSGEMLYIKPDFTTELGNFTVTLNQVDGGGICLPGTFKDHIEYMEMFDFKNAMVRLPWIKGLLSVYDFVRQIDVCGYSPIIKDAWGKEHDVKKEGINIIFTVSQFKMWKFYDSWEEYKNYFKAYGCHACLTNYEEPFIKDSHMNYQFIQTLTDFTNQELHDFIEPTHRRIENIAKDKSYMLQALRADANSDNPYLKALCLYPELLRDGHTRSILKYMKKKWINDAKAGKIKCENKRLFVIPDWYAAIEYYFGHVEHPVGLIPANQVGCRIYQDEDELDVLRSPHLYREHNIVTPVKDKSIYDWFLTNGIYVSSHDLISRTCQFD